MEMTTSEIVRAYKEAADKRKQITILSQMNLCTTDEIRDELIKGGIDGRTLPKKRKQPQKAAANADAANEAEEVNALIKEALENYKPTVEAQLREVEAKAAPLARKISLIEKLLGGGQ